MTADTATPIAHAPTRRLMLSPEAIQQINVQAAQARPGVAAQALIGGLIFGLFWLAGRSLQVLTRSLAWAYMAGRMGWRESRGIATNTPSVEQLLAENDYLRKELARVQ